MNPRSEWNVPVSTFAKKTFNPIRNIVENMKIEPHPDKSMIALSIGDPTVFGNLAPAAEVVQAVVDSVRSGKNNGYVASTGTLPAREAIAEYMSFPGAPVDAKDVIICSGCSCSLDLCLSALCDSGSSVLVPRPGFPLYTTLAKGFGVVSKYYNLLPEKNWLVDLDHLESLIDDTTAAIVINNPSNPCGSVFPRDHLADIAELAVKYKIPIIADEIYDNFVFDGQEYHPIASVHPELPVLACGGLTKRFLVPGWRTGWIAVHDRGGVLAQVSSGLRSLSQRIIGCNTLVQGALPTILKHTPQAFFDDTIAQVQSNALLCYAGLKEIKGLAPTTPQGAMYMMVGIEIDKFPEFSTDLDFVEKLVSEQSVFCLPGKCFDIPNFFRVVLTVPVEKMTEACERMREFCEEHYVDVVVPMEQTDSNSKTNLLGAIKRPRLEENKTNLVRKVSTNGHRNETAAIAKEISPTNALTNGVHLEHNSATTTNGVGRFVDAGTSDTVLINNKEKTQQQEIMKHSDESDSLNSKVVEMQAALIKECAIQDINKDHLMDEMERD